MRQCHLIGFVLMLILPSCKEEDDLANAIDHWEINRTYNIYNNAALSVDTLNNEFDVVDGRNSVLIITLEKNPVFRKGREIADAYSSKALLIELNATDNIVTVSKPSNSRIFRQIIAFVPEYGIKELASSENIKFERIDTAIWKITSEIEDFAFSGELNFSRKQTLVDKQVIDH